MKISGFNAVIGTALVLLLPLLSTALPTGSASNDVVHVMPSGADQTMESVNAILDELHADDETQRTKRAGGSGGFDLLGGLKSQIATIVSRASAQLAGGSSGSSSGSSSSHDPHNVDVAHFDAHQLKRSILNTIFQAVKAITGGITAINGQLIKGSGYAISAGGQLVAKSGDAVSNVGKKIALSAQLVEPQSHGYPTSGGGGGSAGGVHATLTKLISGSSGASSGGSSGGHGHVEQQHVAHVEDELQPPAQQYNFENVADDTIHFAPEEIPQSPANTPLSSLLASASGLSSAVPVSIARVLSSGSSSSSSSSSSSAPSRYTTYDGTYGVSPSGPSSTGAAYVPFDHPTSGGHEQQSGYHGQSYGSTGHGAVSDILTDSYQRPLTTSDSHSAGLGLTDLKSQSVHSAADALRQILEKLPIDKPAGAGAVEHEYHFHTADYHNGNALDHEHAAELDDHHQSFRPYDIPNDPPAFRPLPHQSAAPPPVVNSITHTQIITTAYGQPASNGGNAVGPQATKPITLLDIETDQWQRPIGQGVSSGDGSKGGGSVSLYHVMSVKNHGTVDGQPHHEQPLLHLQPPLQQSHEHDPSAQPAIVYLPTPVTLPNVPTAQHDSGVHSDGVGSHAGGSSGGGSVLISEEVVHHHSHQQHQLHTATAHEHQNQYEYEQHQQQQQQSEQQHPHLQPSDFNDIQQQLLPHYGPPPSPPSAHQQLPYVGAGYAVASPSYEIHKSVAYELHGRPYTAVLPAAAAAGVPMVPYAAAHRRVYKANKRPAKRTVKRVLPRRQ